MTIMDRLAPRRPSPQVMPHKPLFPMVAHKQVAAVAREAAGQLFDTLMGCNEIYEAWKFRNPGLDRKALERLFVSTFSPDCVPFARATLAHMLSLPGIDETTKMSIHEALVLDAQLPGRQSREAAVEIVNKELLR